MKAQDLKRSILQLAIQGKLVPQNPNDEPASELLKKIKAEKEALVKAGKIKKDKQESYIYKGADNNYYEKIGLETKDITDEIPFEIPNSWEWVRLGNIMEIARGGSPRPIQNYITTEDNGLNWIKIGDTDKGGKYISSTKEKIKPEGLKKTRFVHKGDFLLTNSMSFGRPYILNIDGCIHDGWLVISDKFKAFSVDFLYYLISSSFAYNQFCGKVSGAVVSNLNSEKVSSSIFPLPPLSEQERIVKKIEELEPFIEEYGKAEVELTTLNNNFPEQIKKSILQYAIQGKLVEQDPNDEPASVLLEKIKAEKQELIKQGKIKKDKQESYIFKGADNRHYEKIGSETKDITDEIPFEIPESWSWCRLNTICQINPRNAVNDDVEASFIPMNMIQDGFHNKHTFIIKKWKEIKSGFTHFMNNDIGIAKITPCFENRKSVIFTNLINGVGSGTTELHILRPYSEILPEYILLLCKTEHFIVNGVKNFTGTAGQQRINSQFVKEFLCPLPPLNEQKKIINKVSKMFEIIENL